MAGLFLLSVTVYRWQAFTHFAWTIILFKFLVTSSFFLCCYGMGRMVKLPIAVCLALPIVLEGISWFYIQHIIRANQHVEKHSIGVLDKWINYRDVIQFNRQFSSFSPDLGYTLRPNSKGYHHDLEYDNEFIINSFGLRDDEPSLAKPGIIFIGDSFTMGWGIDQDKTFAQLTEQKTGTKALNAGISSYGTYREMLLLSKLHRDSCKLLVIQYCDNDIEENTARNGPEFQSQLLTEKTFANVGIFNRLNESYFPMRYSYFFVREKELFKDIFTQPVQLWHDTSNAIQCWIAGTPPNAIPFTIKSETEVNDHAVQFFKVLSKIREIYPGNIVVMHLDGRYTKPEMINKFETEAQKRNDPKLHFLRACDLLSTSDYYPIDGHLNTSGHEKIASGLHDLIRSQKLLD